MSGRGGGLGEALAWLIFPVVPVLLESAYNGFLGIVPADPRVWDGLHWVGELGPLVGFGYLAGATMTLPDVPTGRRGPRAWLARRSVWVGLGPWSGFLVWLALIWTVPRVSDLVRPLVPEGAFAWLTWPGPGWENTWAGWAVVQAGFAFVVLTFSYAWLAFAYAALRRARGLGEGWASVRRGLTVAAAFVGSLFGGFWAVTGWWRAYFFDPRIVPVLLAAAGVVAVSGCGSPVSYGEVRRRELFHAMLLAWTVGLALLWRWWARPGRGG